MTTLSTPTKAERTMEVTTVSKAHSKYTGLKTPIPATYARDLGLDAGQKITWELDKDSKGKFLKVRKA
jgi:hypothetical protein